MRRLAYVLKSSELGGAQRYVLEHCRRLHGNEFEIEVVLPAGGPLVAEIESLGIRTHHVEIPRYSICPISDLCALNALVRLFRERRYDIVHPQSSKPGFLGRFAAHLAGIPVTMFTYHQTAFHSHAKPLTGAVFQMIDTWLAQQCTSHVITVANHLRDTLIEQRVCSPESTEVIHNGIEPPVDFPTPEERRHVRRDLIGPDSALPVVAFVARLHRPKDPLTFVRAAALCRDRGLEAQFLIIGDGELRPKAERLAQSLGLGENRVRFVGECANAASFLVGADLYVYCSLWEGLPFTLLEAMAAGIPIVCSDIPGCSEIIVEGETGLSAPNESPEALARAIMDILLNPDNARQMGERGYERLHRDFTVERMVRRTAEVYNRVWNDCHGNGTH